MTIHAQGSLAPGFVIRSRNAVNDGMTVCVLGAPRGGTSMVSGLLQLAGINMGDRLSEHQEDQDFIDLHQGDRRLVMPAAAGLLPTIAPQLAVLVRRKCELHRTWGWKDPLCSHYLPYIIQEIRSPRVVWVTRDPVAIAQSEYAFESPPERERMYAYIKNACAQYLQTVKFLAGSGLPVLLVSYERALAEPMELFLLMCRFLDIEPNAETMDKATRYVNARRKALP